MLIRSALDRAWIGHYFRIFLATEEGGGGKAYSRCLTLLIGGPGYDVPFCTGYSGYLSHRHTMWREGGGTLLNWNGRGATIKAIQSFPETTSWPLPHSNETGSLSE